ncbi:hypothetical protein BDW22DRAFT_1354503 [Trametopsis cervina]|nr:hypothetical protein BDW22DRAFT_1354503 [Trametopsis cervina]
METVCDEDVRRKRPDATIFDSIFRYLLVLSGSKTNAHRGREVDAARSQLHNRTILPYHNTLASPAADKPTPTHFHGLRTQNDERTRTHNERMRETRDQSFVRRRYGIRRLAGREGRKRLIVAGEFLWLDGMCRPVFSPPLFCSVCPFYPVSVFFWRVFVTVSSSPGLFVSHWVHELPLRVHSTAYGDAMIPVQSAHRRRISSRTHDMIPEGVRCVALPPTLSFPGMAWRAQLCITCS